eukprot:5661257-Prymnesium_polylepis.1
MIDETVYFGQLTSQSWRLRGGGCACSKAKGGDTLDDDKAEKRRVEGEAPAEAASPVDAAAGAPAEAERLSAGTLAEAEQIVAQIVTVAVAKVEAERAEMERAA